MAEFLGPAIHVPDELSRVEVLSSATTKQTRRLIESAVETYDKSLTFYAEAKEAAGELELRTPADGETVVVLVSDRHDNIGMDAVARAIADRGGATAVFDAGDDTSTGSRWEAFSLDSLTAAFDDMDGRWAVAGNHDHGSFVGQLPRRQRLDRARRGGRRRPGELPDARRARPALERARHLARRDRPQLRGGRHPAGRRGLCRRRGRRSGRHDPGPRRQPRRRGAGARLRRPGARRSPPQPGRSDPGHGDERRDGLQLHHRYDGRGGVRLRARQHASVERPRSPWSPTPRTARRPVSSPSSCSPAGSSRSGEFVALSY